MMNVQGMKHVAPTRHRVLQLSIRADRGGGPKHVESLLSGLRDRFDFYIAAPQEGSYHKRFSELTAGRLALPHRRFSLVALARLVSFVHRNGIDCLHSHGRGAGIYARLTGLLSGVPVIHTHHGIFINQGGIKGTLLVFLERILNRLTRKIIFVSPSEMRHCADLGVLDATKSVVIPNGIDISGSIATRFDFGNRQRPFRMITVTRLEPEKGNLALLEMVACLKQGVEDFVLQVVGEGEELSSLKEHARRLRVEDKVVFLGGRDDVPRLLSESDVYVTCSPGEAQGIAVLEALLHSLPVVASKVRGHTDTIEDGVNGLLFDPKRVDSGAECIRRIIDDGELARRLGEAGRRTVIERYSEQTMAAAVAQQYSAILA
jgi:glycosyltransferase involved in cell wall biosynthesis